MSEILYKAAKYIRLSHASEKDDSAQNESDSVSNQRKIIDSYIKTQPDIEATAEYVDDGITGLIFERKAFKEMMNDIESGKINCVIVKDLSRFGREYIETLRYLRRVFPALGVRLIALTDNIDTLRDDSDDIVVSVKSIMNDSYSRDISIKTRSALNVKRDNGDFVGACPVYGYKKSDENRNKLAIDKYPAGIVRDIFRMKLEGMSAVRIAGELNNLGVLSPLEYKKSRGLPHPKGGYADKNDAKWSAATIIRILNDITYTGTLIQGKQGTLNYKIKDLINKPESEWKRTDDAHDAIISKQDFELAQRIMSLDTRTAPAGDKVYIFSGILICGCCGNRMTRKVVSYKNEKYYYYYCPTTKKRGCAKGVNIKEGELLNCVLESVKKHISNAASLERIVSGNENQKIIDALAKQYEAQINDNECQLKKINGFKSALYENMVNGILSKDDYKSLKTKYNADEKRIYDAIETLENKLEDTLSGTGERLQWMERFKQFEGLTELDRRTVINLIQSIRIVSKTELEITFNYQSEYENVMMLIKQGVA